MWQEIKVWVSWGGVVEDMEFLGELKKEHVEISWVS